MTVSKENTSKGVFPFVRILYGAFVALGVYYLLRKDISEAMSAFGIGLIFDPFDQNVKGNDRPAYQRVWLIVHLSIVLGLVGILLFNWLSK
jgi:H+/Cl- antiporter ClcA